MVLRLGLWKASDAGFLDDLLSLLGFLLGPVSRLLMVLFGCGVVLLIFLIRNRVAGLRGFWEYSQHSNSWRN